MCKWNVFLPFFFHFFVLLFFFPDFSAVRLLLCISPWHQWDRDMGHWSLREWAISPSENLQLKKDPFGGYWKGSLIWSPVSLNEIYVRIFAIFFPSIKTTMEPKINGTRKSGPEQRLPTRLSSNPLYEDYEQVSLFKICAGSIDSCSFLKPHLPFNLHFTFVALLVKKLRIISKWGLISQ